MEALKQMLGNSPNSEEVLLDSQYPCISLLP